MCQLHHSTTKQVFMCLTGVSPPVQCTTQALVLPCCKEETNGAFQTVVTRPLQQQCNGSLH